MRCTTEKRRIIVAIPYTSIIEQTANVLKYGTDDPETIAKIVCGGGEVLFGEDNVLEHHSNLDPEKETEKGRLAAENWDAPLVVTTNVQLFESLFSAKRSRARRVHNIAESVLILDEAQMLPPEYLIPLLSVLRGLVRYLGVYGSFLYGHTACACGADRIWRGAFFRSSSGGCHGDCWRSGRIGSFLRRC
jgi:CRISPR-associated endonuclease/helicase Cas3